MSNIATIQKDEIKTTLTREGILAFEQHLKGLPNSVIGDSELCPVKHTFCDGLYIRQITIPAGVCIVGKIHFDEHPVFLMEGEICVVTEFGKKVLAAPQYFITPQGIKRAALSNTKTVWVTIHSNPTNTQNLEQLEKMIISPDFATFDKHIERKNKRENSIVFKILRKFKNILP